MIIASTPVLLLHSQKFEAKMNLRSFNFKFIRSRRYEIKIKIVIYVNCAKSFDLLIR